MKLLVSLARILVGLLFIFSGLVKANDPHGLSYKMQEFFEVWGWHGLDHLSLPLAIVMNVFEIMAGVALLLGWGTRQILALLFILIISFTFLTGYTYITGKPTNCGCFGDCLPISSKVSFYKDVVLTILIAFLWVQRKYILPVFRSQWGFGIVLLSVLFGIGLQVYALRYLPPVDCLPFKLGASIPEKMLPPPNAVPDSFAIRFVYEKDGKQYEFSASELPADLGNYKYISRTDKLIRKGNADPAIKGFRLTDANDNDRTNEILTQPYALILFVEDLDKRPLAKWGANWKSIAVTADSIGLPYYIVARFPEKLRQPMEHLLGHPVEILNIDVVAMHTAARSNPCLYLLKEGVIVDKQADRRFNLIENRLSGLQIPTPQPGAAMPDSSNNHTQTVDSTNK